MIALFDLGLWEPSAASAAAPPGSLRVAELSRILFDTWRRGGAWDEARGEPEMLRVPQEHRDPSPVGVLRDIVLDALCDLGEGQWGAVPRAQRLHRRGSAGWRAQAAARALGQARGHRHPRGGEHRGKERFGERSGGSTARDLRAQRAHSRSDRAAAAQECAREARRPHGRVQRSVGQPLGSGQRFDSRHAAIKVDGRTRAPCMARRRTIRTRRRRCGRTYPALCARSPASPSPSRFPPCTASLRRSIDRPGWVSAQAIDALGLR